MIEFTSKHVPRFNPVSISGYHIREAGSTAVQELAFTLADGLGYVEAALARGLPVDSFAPRLSFFFDIHNDFFEEIAKLRAARRMLARFMKERYGEKEAAGPAYRYRLVDDGGGKVVVGLNKPVMREEKPITPLRIDGRLELEQIAEVARFKAARDMPKVGGPLEEGAEACRHGQNVM